MPLEGEKRPFGESRRWGDRREDLSIKPLESGRADRLRQKESRWNGALEVAADPGLTWSRSGERAMIGGATGDGWGSSLWRVQVSGCASVQPRYRSNKDGDAKTAGGARNKVRDKEARTAGTANRSCLR
jgi:hypothetical protein